MKKPWKDYWQFLISIGIRYRFLYEFIFWTTLFWFGKQYKVVLNEILFLLKIYFWRFAHSEKQPFLSFEIGSEILNSLLIETDKVLAITWKIFRRVWYSWQQQYCRFFSTVNSFFTIKIQLHRHIVHSTHCLYIATNVNHPVLPTL